MSAQQAITLIMLTWGVYLIHDGAISQGALIGAVMFAQRAIQPLGMLVNLATRYQGARAAMKSIDELMSKPLERDEDKTYVSPPEFTGQLALRDVSFSYPAQGDDVKPFIQWPDINTNRGAGPLGKARSMTTGLIMVQPYDSRFL